MTTCNPDTRELAKHTAVIAHAWRRLTRPATDLERMAAAAVYQRLHATPNNDDGALLEQRAAA